MCPSVAVHCLRPADHPNNTSLHFKGLAKCQAKASSVLDDSAGASHAVMSSVPVCGPPASVTASKDVMQHSAHLRLLSVRPARPLLFTCTVARCSSVSPLSFTSRVNSPFSLSLRLIFSYVTAADMRFFPHPVTVCLISASG